MRGMIAMMLLCSALSFGQEDVDDKRDFQAVFGFTAIGIGVGFIAADSFGVAQDKTTVTIFAVGSGLLFILLDILNSNESKTTKGEDE